MEGDFIIALGHSTVEVTLFLAGPLLLISMVVGLVVSIIQAATQIQEMTLVFVPKMLAVFAGVVIFGTFMLDEISAFTRMIFEMIAATGA